MKIGTRRKFHLPKLVFVLSAILLSANSLCAQKASAPAYRFSSGQSALGIPFELHNNLIFVRTRANDSAPLWFLVDSGAEVSVIKRSRAEALGLQFEGKGSTDASGGSVDFVNVAGVTLGLPGAEILNPTVVAFPLESFEPLLGRTVDGILGADLFNRFVVEIDYASNTMSLYDQRSYRYRGRGETVPITLKENSPYVELSITPKKGAGKSKGVFAIDTGSDSTVVLNAPFAKAMRAGESAKTIESRGLGAGGETSSSIVRMEKIKLGRYVMKKPLVRISQDEKGELASTAFSGLIGGELLRRFRVVFQYAKRRMILESNTEFAEPDEFNMSGATFVFQGSDFSVLTVDSVMTNTPAAEAGLVPGDIVAAIDGEPASEYNAKRLRRMLKQDGASHLFEIKRSTNVMQIRIKLRRLI